MRPDIDTALDDQPAKTAFWNGFQGAGAMVGRATALLSTRRAAALVVVVTLLVAWDAGAGVLPNVGIWPDVLVVALLLLHLLGSVARSTAATARGLLRSVRRSSSWHLLDLAETESVLNVASCSL